MRFVIITHVQHIEKKGEIYGYAPYVREMNLWIKNTDELILIAPKSKGDIDPIWLSYEHKKKKWLEVPSFNLTSFKAIAHFIISLPILIYQINKGFRKADHIHLRCPGNMGLLGAIIQIFFPRKKKTAKYAGNWDPNAKQPWSYKFQKWILSNTFLTRNMQVLVYGEWPNQTSNIKPFFTATYEEKEKVKSYFSEKFNNVLKKEIKILFVGTLTLGKNPLYSIQIVQELLRQGYNISLELYGEGILKEELLLYVKQNHLQKSIFFRGNQTKEKLKEAYIKSHFLILPSKSEGWPKAVAEAMFWGTIPLVTRVSCVSNMLNNDERGILLKEDIDDDVRRIIDFLQKEKFLKRKSEKAQIWSQYYTIEEFELAISKLLIP
ncbi:glycosyltransferase [Flavobacterium columnare]|uniref:glycosyltransferase n=1 Tax=Flavobacterium covae TaxID=2906076 RepID=UPI000B5BC55D|nr:glycosyl transferase [Flavobacterium columnare] [Flavobacterium columnare NBRC 100251 = ATCC 23463]